MSGTEMTEAIGRALEYLGADLLIVVGGFGAVILGLRLRDIARDFEKRRTASEASLERIEQHLDDVQRRLDDLEGR